MIRPFVRLIYTLYHVKYCKYQRSKIKKAFVSLIPVENINPYPSWFGGLSKNLLDIFLDNARMSAQVANYRLLNTNPLFFTDKNFLN